MLNRGVWSAEEHARFLVAIREYPHGPWGQLAAHIGTRSARQVQTHAQRYQEKIQRHARGLRRLRLKSRHKEHRIDENALRAHMEETSYDAHMVAHHSASCEQSGYWCTGRYPASPTEVNYCPWAPPLQSPTWKPHQYHSSYQPLASPMAPCNDDYGGYGPTRIELPSPPVDVLLRYLPKKSPVKASPSSCTSRTISL